MRLSTLIMSLWTSQSLLFSGGLVVAAAHVPFIEQSIVLSVILMGGLLLGMMRFSVAISATVADPFTVFHDTAHGIETPLHIDTIEYRLEFTIATFALHIIGLGFGLAITHFQMPIIIRIIGSTIALTGSFYSP